MLENAVASIRVLCQVTIHADLDTTRSGIPLTYQQYMNLLQSTATAYDNQLKSTTTKQQVFLHQQYDDIDEDQPDTDPFDNDASVTFI